MRARIAAGAAALGLAVTLACAPATATAAEPAPAAQGEVTAQSTTGWTFSHKVVPWDGWRISTSTGQVLVFQRDGNLVGYSNGVVAWASHTAGRADSMILQSDGNVVIYAPGGRPIFQSGTAIGAGWHTIGVSRWGCPWVTAEPFSLLKPIKHWEGC